MGPIGGTITQNKAPGNRPNSAPARVASTKRQFDRVLLERTTQKDPTRNASSHAIGVTHDSRKTSPGHQKNHCQPWNEWAQWRLKNDSKIKTFGGGLGSYHSVNYIILELPQQELG